MTTRKPLFSRQQLNLLILVLSVVIALLSFSVPQPPQLNLQRSEVEGIRFAWPATPLGDELRIDLLLRLPPELAEDAPETRLLMALLQEQVSSTVDHATPPQARVVDDSVRLTLPSQSAHRQALLRQLVDPLSSSDQIRAVRRLRAMQALDRSPSHRLWTATSPADAPRYRNWLSRSQLWLLSNRALTAREQQRLVDALSPLPEGTPWGALDTATPLPVQRLPGRTEAHFDTVWLALLWLQPFAERNGLTLRFEPRSHQSRLAVLNSAGQPATTAQLNALRTTATAESKPLEQAQSRWLRQLQTDSEQIDSGMRLLTRLTLYNRPADGLTRFGEQIKHLTLSALNAQLDRLLDPNRYHPIPAQESADHGTSERPKAAQRLD